MRVIDLLNKIANGEESDTITEFEFDKRIWNFFKLQDSEYCVDGWLLNQEIVITKHKEVIEEQKEDKKIEKIDMFDYFTGYDFDGTSKDLRKHLKFNFQTLNNKINEIIDYIMEDKNE
jgi:hypothetical protein